MQYRFTVNVNVYPIKLVMVYNVETTNLIFVDKICDI
jgi:hypothetical protein